MRRQKTAVRNYRRAKAAQKEALIENQDKTDREREKVGQPQRSSHQEMIETAKMEKHMKRGIQVNDRQTYMSLIDIHTGQ